MAGYMTKLQGYVYEGELVNGTAAAVKNGTILVLGTSTNAGKLVAPAKDTSAKFLLKEICDVEGATGYRFIANVPNKNYYFVENGYEYNTDETYNTSTYTTPVGALLRAHPILSGEEFVTTEVDGTLTVGTEYNVLASGKIGTAT